MTCGFAHDDGAFVLGALSPADRAEFERHLAGCVECARGVQELAGLPGLLGRVPEEVLEPIRPEGVPETLLPALVREVRRSQRRRTAVLAGLAAAAAVVVAGGSVLVAGALEPDSSPTTSATPSAPPSTAPALPMQTVGAAPVSGSLALTSVAWGTRIDLVCTYDPDEVAYSSTYVMVVRTRDGDVEQVATWKALPGRSMRLPAATAASRDDIASVEVRTAGGSPVLQLAE